jgi:sugar phosphate isomerase/epimerase
MIIGFKLDAEFIGSDECARLFGGRDAVTSLRALCVEAVETRIGPDSDREAVFEHLRRCCDAGFRVSLHPYSERTSSNPVLIDRDDVRGDRCREFHRRCFELAAAAAQRQGAPVVVNIHGAASTGDPRQHMVSQSVRFFTWAREWCGRHAPDVTPVAELQIRPNPDESIQRVGDGFEELLQVAARSGVGVCWDFGHGVMNSRRFGDPLDPSDEFAARVVHVHCHDVDVTDHQPLVHGAVPWERFLTRLIDGGYDGAAILELSPTALLSCGGFDALSGSVDALLAFRESRGR